MVVAPYLASAVPVGEAESLPGVIKYGARWREAEQGTASFQTRPSNPRSGKLLPEVFADWALRAVFWSVVGKTPFLGCRPRSGNTFNCTHPCLIGKFILAAVVGL